MLFKSKKTNVSPIAFNEIITPDINPEIRNVFQDICIKISRLDFSGNCKKIAVASSHYAEGKTYAAVNIALMLADTFVDEKVLLVDVDFKAEPESTTLNSLIPNKNTENGISEYLAGKSDEINTLSTHLPNLFVCCCGEKSDAPARAMTSKRLDEFMEQISNEYQYVIFNNAPINETAYSTALSGKVDGYILVAREGITSVDSLSDSEDKIIDSGSRVFGIVLLSNQK